jgi:hypothetical protein
MLEPLNYKGVVNQNYNDATAATSQSRCLSCFVMFQYER